MQGHALRILEFHPASAIPVCEVIQAFLKDIWSLFSTDNASQLYVTSTFSFPSLLPLVPSSICIFCSMEEVTAQDKRWSFLLKLVPCPSYSLLLVLVFPNSLIISHVSLHKKQDERTV